jgi:hypothetical protein
LPEPGRRPALDHDLEALGVEADDDSRGESTQRQRLRGIGRPAMQALSACGPDTPMSGWASDRSAMLHLAAQDEHLQALENRGSRSADSCR